MLSPRLKERPIGDRLTKHRPSLLNTLTKDRSHEYEPTQINQPKPERGSKRL